MLVDFWLVVRWWGVLFLVGASALPLTKRLFRGWYDNGYFFSKAVGMAVITYLVYLVGTAHVLPFSSGSIFAALVLVFFVGGFLLLKDKVHHEDKGNKILVILAEELSFFAVLLFWSWIKAHEPSIRGLEKFMDFGFMKSILNTQYFPAPDMWYAGHGINYYYFGHIVTAVLTKLSGIDLASTFNLMLATIFALTLTMSFSIGKQIGHIAQMRRIGQIAGGVLTAFLVTLAGNLQTLYAFTKGYTGDKVQPFWQLLWPVGDIFHNLPEGIKTYWYANATRFIPYTIHEFPGYSFVVSDVHGHVLSLPFILLAIALLIMMSLPDVPSLTRDDAAISTKSRLFRRMNGLAMTNIIFYGFLVGILLMTNALDGPIYLALFLIIFGLVYLMGKKEQRDKRKFFISIVFMVLSGVVFALPFLFHFKSFVSGIAINCPPAFLANTKLGPLLFEGVEKCQHSPIWMILILWGFFLCCGGALLASKFRLVNSSGKWKILLKTNFTHLEKLLFVFFFFSLALIVFPEFFYFKDIYPMHFRSNTMFKLGYQAFILFSIASSHSIIRLLFGQSLRIKKILFAVIILPQLFLVSIYPVFAVRSYFGELKKYEGLDGLGWMRREYPSDFDALRWLQNQDVKCRISNIKCEIGTIVEADGDSYTDYARFSAFTGNPTIIGWAVHEWLWRGGYDVVAPLREDVRKIYEENDIKQTKSLLNKYRVRYAMVGSLERTKFNNLQEWKFTVLGTKVFQSGETVIYQIPLK